MLSRLRRICLRPSLWVFIITIVAYWDEQALHGSFVYDDGGSVKTNVVVNGNRPLHEVFIRDYWGTLMSQPQSHKSFRPITTLTFRANWVLAEQELRRKKAIAKSPPPVDVGGEIDTLGFHLVNLLLHGVVSALVTEAAAFIFLENGESSAGYSQVGVVLPRLITGLIFGLHPVHVEAVTNITSRGELLMSLFFLLAFLIYASNLPVNISSSTTGKPFSFTTTISIYILPWICMTLSVFSKEQGATTLVALFIYDFIKNHVSVKDFLLNAMSKKLDPSAIAFIRRGVILTVQSFVVAVWRKWLNGETSPDFIYAQNPAGFSEDRFTRVFSVSWVYCLYIWDAIYPNRLCPDWSGVSIDLIKDWNDYRIAGVLALWTFAAACLYSLFFGSQYGSSAMLVDIRRILLTAFFGFLFSPFLLSSNLLVVVGLMKGDRVIYLPLMGFAIMEALLVRTLFFGSLPSKNVPPGTLASTTRLSARVVFGYLLVMVVMTLFSAKLHERNVAWSHSLNLWVSAYMINPRSSHTIYNCGYELSLKLRYAESEQVLRPIGNPRTEGPSNTFVYAMVLYNLKRCDIAHALIDDALVVVEESRHSGGVRNTDGALSRARSNLLVAKGFCTEDMTESGQVLYDAVQADPTNQYAIDQATRMAEHIKAMKQMEEQRAMLGLK